MTWRREKGTSGRCTVGSRLSVKKVHDWCTKIFTSDAWETNIEVRVLKIDMAWNVQKIRPGTPQAWEGENMEKHETTLGDVIEAFYSELVEEYGDEDLAEVVAATLVNEMILSGLQVDQEIAAA